MLVLGTNGNGWEKMKIREVPITGAGNRMGPDGNHMGTEMGVENRVVPITDDGNHMGTRWEPYGNF